MLTPTMVENVAQAAGMQRLAALASRWSEAAAVAGGGLYLLGVLRLTGELSDLHLSSPSVIANFAHSDILMLGVGVLVSQAAGAVVLAWLLGLFISDATRARVNDLLGQDDRRVRMASLATGMVGAVLLTLAARWWEGALFVALVTVWWSALWLARRPLTRAHLVAQVLCGLFLVGVAGSYLNPPPPARAVATTGETTVEGLAVGMGEEGEWYIATAGDDGSYRLTVVGGPAQKPDSMQILPARDQEYRILYFELVDR